MEDLKLTGQGKLYINQSLYPYYRVLWSKSKFYIEWVKYFHITWQMVPQKLKYRKLHNL